MDRRTRRNEPHRRANMAIQQKEAVWGGLQQYEKRVFSIVRRRKKR